MKREIVKDARSVPFGFLGQKMAANFAVLQPLQLANQVEFAKGKIMDLDGLRSRFENDIFKESREWHEVLIYIQDSERVAYSSRQHEEVERSLKLIKSEGERYNVQVEAFNSIDGLTNEILLREA